MEKPYGRSKCPQSQISLHRSGSACANTQVLAPGLCCISPKHSPPLYRQSILLQASQIYPLHFHRRGFPNSLCISSNKYIYTSHMDFHVIQVKKWSAGRASYIVVAKPRNKSLSSSLRVDEVCWEWRLELLRALFSLFICPFVFNIFFSIPIFISVFAAFYLVLYENRLQADPCTKQNIS